MPAGLVPAVSVLMSVRNGARYLEEALDSLATQTFGDFEIVLIENGSTDGTAAIVAAWEAREPRLRVFRLPEVHLARNLNFAASQARAPLLARLDADDVALPERLAVQHAAMSERPSVGVLGSAAEVIDRNGRRLGEIRADLANAELRKVLRQRCALVNSSTMIRADLFRLVGGYRAGLNVSEDYDLWCRLSEVCEIANLPTLLIRYRIHNGSVTSRHPARMAVARLCVTAAQAARRTGRPEPFSTGTPNLRQAQALLGLSRERCREIVRLMTWRSSVSRRWFALPLPSFAKSGIRRAATRMRLRPIYLFCLKALAGFRREPRDPLPGPAEVTIQEAPG